MAINFLDNLDLNDNQLLNARLQNLASDPTQAKAGDIIFNTTSGKLKYYDGTSPFSAAGWIDPSAGDYTKWIFSEGTNFDIIDGDTVALNSDSAYPGVRFSTSKTGTVVTTLSRFYPKDISGTTGLSDYTADFLIYQDTSDGFKAKKTLTGDIPLNKFGTATGDINMGSNLITDVTDPSSAQDAATKAYVDANAGTTYTLPTGVPAANAAKITLTGSDSSTDIVNFKGQTNQTKITAATQGQIIIGLADSITTVGDLTVGGGDIILDGTGRIQGIDTVTASTDAASKNYVDNTLAGSGSLIFQGGYDANTNTPNLDSTPTLDIKKGWTYVVTVAGNFFTETVEVGDLLIAEVNDPIVLANWTTVQNNVDLASLTNVGIGNVNSQTGPTTGNQMTGIDVRYSSGTAQVGIDILSQDNYTAGSTDVDNDFLLISQATDVNGDTKNNKISLNSLQTAIGLRTFSGTSASGTTHTFTHNLNTRNVMVQLFDTSSFETVYATVVRTSVNVVTVTTASTADITCLISEV